LPARAEQVAAVLDRYAMERATAEMHRYVLLGQLVRLSYTRSTTNWAA